MKKIIMTLAAALAFTSALATKHTSTADTKVMTDAGADTFVLQKAPLNLDTLKLDNHILVGQNCSQTCFVTFRACLAAGLPGCNARFIRCIDTCEGAGGLYR